MKINISFIAGASYVAFLIKTNDLVLELMMIFVAVMFLYGMGQSAAKEIIDKLSFAKDVMEKQHDFHMNELKNIKELAQKVKDKLNYNVN